MLKTTSLKTLKRRYLPLPTPVTTTLFTPHTSHYPHSTQSTPVTTTLFTLQNSHYPHSTQSTPVTTHTCYFPNLSLPIPATSIILCTCQSSHLAIPRPHKNLPPQVLPTCPLPHPTPPSEMADHYRRLTPPGNTSLAPLTLRYLWREGITVIRALKPAVNCNATFTALHQRLAKCL